MRYLRTNTATRVTVGPFLDKTDGITPKTALTATNEHLTLIVDSLGTPVLALDANATASGGNNDMFHITNDDAGYYDLELTAINLSYLGRAVLSINYATDHCPVFHEFMILPANVYDALVSGTDNLNVNATKVNGTAQTAGDLAALIGALPSAAGVADAVWDEATAGHQTAGTSGKALTDAGGAGTPPTVSEIADAVLDEALAGHVAAGSVGAKLSSLSSMGIGNTEVDHNTGGVDNLKYVDGNGVGVDGADIKAFLKSDYDAGNRSDVYLKDYSKTTVTGAWQWPMHLDSGNTYTIEFYKQNLYTTSTKEITI